MLETFHSLGYASHFKRVVGVCTEHKYDTYIYNSLNVCVNMKIPPSAERALFLNRPA